MTSIPRRQARTALLEAALDRLAEVGPMRVHPNEICAELGLSKALVNYHFGNRDGLLLEATALGYERYVDTLAAAAAAAGPTALDRLLAWIDAQVEWTAAHPGLAAALNFPSVIGDEPVEGRDRFEAQIQEAGTRNFSNLWALVVAAHREARGPEATPVVEDLALDSVVVGWLTFGMSIWFAGRHLPTRSVGEADDVARARARAREVVTRFVTGRPDPS